MTAIEAREKTIWRNIKGTIRRAIAENVDEGLFSATVEERFMDMETLHNLQLLGYSTFLQRDTRMYIIKW